MAQQGLNLKKKKLTVDTGELYGGQRFRTWNFPQTSFGGDSALLFIIIFYYLINFIINALEVEGSKNVVKP